MLLWNLSARLDVGQPARALAEHRSSADFSGISNRLAAVTFPDWPHNSIQRDTFNTHRKNNEISIKMYEDSRPGCTRLYRFARFAPAAKSLSSFKEFTISRSARSIDESSKSLCVLEKSRIIKNASLEFFSVISGSSFTLIEKAISLLSTRVRNRHVLHKSQ